MKPAVALCLPLALFAQPVFAEDKLSGVGVELKLGDGSLVVMKVLPDSPAARAGIQRGEWIVAVDGRSTAGISRDDVMKLLPGERGSFITLTVASNGRAPRKLRLQREPIHTRDVVDAANEDAVLAAAEARNRALARRALQAVQEEPAVPVEIDPETLRDALAKEVDFMAKVGELTPGQRERLKQNGTQAVERRGNLFVRRNNLAARMAVVANGRRVLRPETPDQMVRRELAPVLKDISREAWEKFDAERERLDQRRRRAAELAYIAALDEALLLTDDQREKFCDLLGAPWTRAWSRRGSDGPDPIQICLGVSDSFDLFDVPEAWRQEIVRPSQEAAYNLVQQPARLETVFVEPAPAAKPAGENNGAAVQGRWPGVGLERAEVARHGLPLNEERQRLQSLLERLIEDTDVQVDLDDAQKQKLDLAGRLDIERHFRQQAALEEEKGGSRKIVGTVHSQVAGPMVRLPPIFAGSTSTFQKTLHSRLSPGQLQKLAEGERERGRFHRLATLAALAVAVSNRAALTDAQTQQVEDWFNANLASPDNDDDFPAWRLATLKQLGALRPAAFKPLVDDWQWPAAREYLKELAGAAEAQEVRLATPLPAAGVKEMLQGMAPQP